MISLEVCEARLERKEDSGRIARMQADHAGGNIVNQPGGNRQKVSPSETGPALCGVNVQHMRKSATRAGVATEDTS